MFKVQSFQTLQLQPLVFQVSAIAATPIYICKLPSSKRDRSYTENPLTHHLTMGTFKHISQELDNTFGHLIFYQGSCFLTQQCKRLNFFSFLEPFFCINLHINKKKSCVVDNFPFLRSLIKVGGLIFFFISNHFP